MKDSVEVLASLLARAYSIEASVARGLAEMMVCCEDESIFNSICNIMVDNEKHKIMLRRAVEALGFGIETLKEYAEERMGIKSFDFSEDLTPDMLNILLRWERWALRYYRYLLRFNFSEISEELGDEVAKKVRDILKELVASEASHIKIIESLL